MTKQDVFDALKEVLSAVKPKLNQDDIAMESSLQADLDIDDQSMQLIILAIENRFGIQFPAQKPFSTVNGMLDYVFGALSSRN